MRPFVDLEILNHAFSWLEEPQTDQQIMIQPVGLNLHVACSLIRKQAVKPLSSAGRCMAYMPLSCAETCSNARM